MLTQTTQAVLLLTAHFSKPSSGDPKPLTPAEWGRFALWLKDQGLTPEALLTGDPTKLLGNWADDKVPQEHICALLARSSALALALEKWHRAGLWVMTRSDPDYPYRLKKQLKNSSPPLFFGCGNRHLLNRGGLTVVGSRDATEGDLDFARQLGSETAEAGYSIVSGGARGIDESAMQGALKKEGTVIGVLADRLLKAATSSKYRQALMAQNLVLTSPFNPEAGFDVGNAMARNKYVYCLADAAVVVHSSTKGGTWSGALENLKNGWVPLWVKPTDDRESGNAQLVAKGARCLSGGGGKLDIRQLFERPPHVESPPMPGTLFDTPVTPVKSAVRDDQREFDQGTKVEAAAEVNNPTEPDKPAEAEVSTPMEGEADSAEANVEGRAPPAESDEWEACKNMTLYEFFLGRMQMLAGKEPKTVDQLLPELDISKTQLNAWLKRATEEGRLKKKNAPVRYSWLPSESQPKQASIF
jgi:predicted Rossmann fold nucleotide-binding protein DprA/Smf involved in DNA uptake